MEPNAIRTNTSKQNGARKCFDIVEQEFLCDSFCGVRLRYKSYFFFLIQTNRECAHLESAFEEDLCCLRAAIGDAHIEFETTDLWLRARARVPGMNCLHV